MATIITVHGTGASGPPDGDMWWQRGSEFQADIRRLVESEDGSDIAILPVVWDGANSEVSRRTAGRKLFGTMLALDRQGEPFCAIGHSHGGSVILHALTLAAFKRRKLRGLKSWVTIGTPFIALVKARPLFVRLGLFGKSAYILFLTYFLLFGLLIFSSADRAEFGTGALIAVGTLAILLLQFPFVIGYFVMRMINRRALYGFRRRVRRTAHREFSPRWLPLCHKDDEAINSLGYLKQLKVELFSQRFAVSGFSLLSLFIVPGALFVGLHSESLVLSLFDYSKQYISPSSHVIKDGQLVGMGKDFFMNLQFFVQAISGLFTYKYLPLLSLSAAHTIWIVLFALPVALYLSSLLVTAVMALIGLAVSRVLSKVLNALTAKQMRRSALGNDNLGEVAVDALKELDWMGRRCPLLPDALAGEISDHSNEAAAAAVVKLRGALYKMAAAESGDSGVALTDYLSWEELVHTSYFAVPRFTLLVAYGLGKADGFKWSPALRSHPDFELVAGWYRDMYGDGYKPVEEGGMLAWLWPGKTASDIGKQQAGIAAPKPA